MSTKPFRGPVIVAPVCRHCDQPCQFYGLYAGFSVLCEACNEKNARRSRESRARRKAKL